MRKALQAYVTTLIILFISLTATANNEVDFVHMDNEIHLKPLLSYQKLIAMQSSSQSYDENTYLWWLLRKAQAERAIYFYDDFNDTVKHAISLITNKTPTVIQARLHIFQGINYRRHGKYILSQQVLSKALNQAKQARLSRLYIIGKKELAFTKVLTEYYETSLVDLQEAYVEAFALKDLFLMAAINEVYGVVYSHLKEFEKSIEYFKRALDSYKHLQYPAEVAKASGELASAYRYWKKYDLAIESFKQYQKNISYTPHAKKSFFSAYGLAVSYAEKGDCKLALIAIERALQLQGLEHHDAELYKKKASCLITLGQLDDAETALFNAENEFLKLPDLMGTAWQLELIKISGELAHARGEHDLGYKMLKKYYQQYTDLLVKNSSDEASKVKNLVSGERKDIAKILDKKRSEVAKLTVEKYTAINTQKLYLSILVFSILFVILVVFLMQYRHYKTVQGLAIKDTLSGLFNRRYIFDYLSKLIASSPQDKIDLAVILIDIDNLKNINDKFGYPMGDSVIGKVANIGKQVFRQGDVFSRIAGEEFFCVLPRTNIEEAEKVAQRFLTIVNKSELINNNRYKVTVSIGVAKLCSQCHDATQLLVNAEQALYQAKHLGKNQVSVFKISEHVK